MKKTLLSLLMLGGVLTAVAQPRCNADGTVTFTYRNDSAKSVFVNVQFAGRQAMTRDASTNMWTVTLGPAAPDMYPYCYIVDGVSVMDPDNPEYFPNEGFKNSLLEISDRNQPLLHDKTSVPHGRVEYIHYYSKSLGATNTAVVYLPPNYMVDFDKKYPVFYLISGTTDTEEVYYKVGRVNYIMDNLLASKGAKEMIIVLPYGNPSKLKAPLSSPQLGGGSDPHPLSSPDGPPLSSSEGDSMGSTAKTNEAPSGAVGGVDVFSRDLINDLMPYIEKNYRTINNRDNRAIGGFSRGGNQALYNGLTNLDKFSYLCSYSSFTSTDIPDVYDKAADTNKKLHLFWLGVGTDDFLYGNARDYMQFLDDKGIRSVKEFTSDKFGHTWMNAKYFLGQTLPLLFNKKASEEAMRNGQPAPAATGHEPQFTPSVMARMFPRPLVSPDYGEQGITFRFKAPNAAHVSLELEMEVEPRPMVKDTAGVWSIVLTDYLFETFKYCFVVDGTRVADPQNMYLSPDRGFKYSIADNPQSPFNFTTQGDIEHGKVSYDLDRHEGWYTSPMPRTPTMPAFIQLVPGEDDTMESWFTVGGVAAIVDRLTADGRCKPCVITTSTMDFMQHAGMPGMPAMPGFKVNTLRADDYPTWSLRRRALVKLLLDIKRQPDPTFPGMGGGFGGPGGF